VCDEGVEWSEWVRRGSGGLDLVAEKEGEADNLTWELT